MKKLVALLLALTLAASPARGSDNTDEQEIPLLPGRQCGTYFFDTGEARQARQNLPPLALVGRPYAMAKVRSEYTEETWRSEVSLPLIVPGPAGANRWFTRDFIVENHDRFTDLWGVDPSWFPADWVSNNQNKFNRPQSYVMEHQIIWLEHASGNPEDDYCLRTSGAHSLPAPTFAPWNWYYWERNGVVNGQQYAFGRVNIPGGYFNPNVREHDICYRRAVDAPRRSDWELAYDHIAEDTQCGTREPYSHNNTTRAPTPTGVQCMFQYPCFAPNRGATGEIVLN